jgi:glycosyltransferase involved in cell wall biosynthesis
MKPTISLCMIVKNEEKVIDRCLSSVAHLVEEIIIVDTGSTDRTKEIASKYTDKIYDYEWRNDFSAARNFAASKATGEWILVLDADEYIDSENFKSFVVQLEEDNGVFNVYAAKILNFSGNFGEALTQHFHHRIYKNNAKISYYRHIHEQLKSDDSKELKTKTSCLLIFHSGYLNQTVKEKNKHKRNKALLEKELNNKVKNPFDYFNIGNEYASVNEYEKALEFYLKSYKLKSDFRLSWVPTALVQIVFCLINLKRFNDALNVINDAQNVYPASPEFPYLKGEIYFQRGQFEDAKEEFQQIINNGHYYNDFIIWPNLKDEKPHLRLGEIFLYEEDYQQSIFHFASVLNINKFNTESINNVIYILSKFHSNDEILNFISSNHLVNEKNLTQYIRSCFDLGNIPLALNLLQDFYDDFKLLYTVAKLKQICVYGEGDIKETEGIFQVDVLQNLLDSNWINLIDIVLLKDKLNSDLQKNIKKLKQSNQIDELIKLLSGNKKVMETDQNLVVYALQQLFKYKTYDLCNTILFEIEKCNKELILEVARILFLNNFKAEALQLYNLCDWDKFNKIDFINIINSLLQTNNIDSALEIAKFGTIKFEEDFRFYKYILENTQDTFLYEKTLQKAWEMFNNVGV